MRSIHLLAVLFLLLFTAGCKTIDVRSTMSPEEARTYRVESEETGMGYIIGSFSYFGHHPGSIAKAFGTEDTFRYNSYTFKFRPVPQREQELIGNIRISGTLWTNSYDPDFELEEGAGRVFVMPIEPGQYEFFQYSFFSNTGMSTSTWTAKEDFSIPFEIEAGKAHYIGEIRAVHDFAKNVFNITIPWGGYHLFYDSYDRDMPILLGQYPFLQQVEVVRDPIDLKKAMTAMGFDVHELPAEFNESEEGHESEKAVESTEK